MAYELVMCPTTRARKNGCAFYLALAQQVCHFIVLALHASYLGLFCRFDDRKATSTRRICAKQRIPPCLMDVTCPIERKLSGVALSYAPRLISTKRNEGHVMQLVSPPSFHTPNEGLHDNMATKAKHPIRLKAYRLPRAGCVQHKKSSTRQHVTDASVSSGPIRCRTRSRKISLFCVAQHSYKEFPM